MDPTIYNSASKDVYTASIPARADNKFIPSNGQRILLNDASYDILRSMAYELTELEKERDQLIESIIQSQSLHEDDFNLHLSKTKQIENQIEEYENEISVLKNEIYEEEQRLLARSFQIPKDDSTYESLDIDEDKNYSKPGQKSKSRFQWLGGIGFVLALEIFIGVAQYNSFAEYKSVLEIITRIAASALIILMLYIAKNTFSNKSPILYRGFIIISMVNLLLMLFGSLVLNYFYPNSGVDSSMLSSWTITDVNSVSPVQSQPSWIGFYIANDYLPAILSVIVYLFIYFLSKESKNDKKAREIYQESAIEDDEPTVFHRLQYLRNKLKEYKNSRWNLKMSLQKTEYNPSKTMSSLNVSLEKKKNKLDEVLKLIKEKNSQIEKIIARLEAELELYKTDFLDVFRSTPNYNIITPEWPNATDIKEYFKIKNHD